MPVSPLSFNSTGAGPYAVRGTAGIPTGECEAVGYPMEGWNITAMIAEDSPRNALHESCEIPARVLQPIDRRCRMHVPVSIWRFVHHILTSGWGYFGLAPLIGG